MTDAGESTEPAPRQVPLLLMLIAGLFLGPGAGHFLIRKWRRGVVFAVAFLAITALLNVLSALRPSPITVALLWLPPFLRVLALVDLVRIAPDERTAEKLGTFLVYAGAAVLAWFGLRTLIDERVTQPFVMPSGSMQPTIAVGDYFVISKLLGPPKRGDVVVAGQADKPQELLAKRVIGVGGDHIEIAGESVRVNGMAIPVCELGNFDYEGTTYRLLVEGHGSPHLIMLGTGERDGEKKAWDVPAGEVFVMGDNRDNSHDSRSWLAGKGGGVSESSIAGYATFFMQRGGQLRVQDIKRIELPKSAAGLRDRVQPCLDQLAAGG